MCTRNHTEDVGALGGDAAREVSTAPNCRGPQAEPGGGQCFRGHAFLAYIEVVRESLRPSGELLVKPCVTGTGIGRCSNPQGFNNSQRNSKTYIF